ncbi:MAG TPA: hypothetical protein PLX41_11720 [Bacteroidales bacterium]|nr:hypothetical protein [Bacteroidales bacterium]
MKNILIYAVSILFALIISSNPLPAQELTSVKVRQNTPERAAEGQTKWMISQLKLKPDIYKELYNINLKYFSRSDSVHSTSLALASKREFYSDYSKLRYEELKKILTSDQFEQYQKIIESIKADSKLVKQ